MSETAAQTWLEPDAVPGSPPVVTRAEIAPLEVRSLTVRFGGLVAVSDLSFEVRRGSILGIIGPNGAGKSTVFEAISGFLRPQSGEIILKGEDITRLPPHKRAHRGLGRSFQDGRLFLSLTVSECIGIALERHVPVAGPFSVMLSGAQARASSRIAHHRIDEVIEQMGLGEYRDTYVRELSPTSPVPWRTGPTYYCSTSRRVESRRRRWRTSLL